MLCFEDRQSDVSDSCPPWPRQVPPQLVEHLRLNPAGNYMPVLFNNDFWLLKDKYVPVSVKHIRASQPQSMCIVPTSLFASLPPRRKQAFPMSALTRTHLPRPCAREPEAFNCFCLSSFQRMRASANPAYAGE